MYLYITLTTCVCVSCGFQQFSLLYSPKINVEAEAKARAETRMRLKMKMVALSKATFVLRAAYGGAAFWQSQIAIRCLGARSQLLYEPWRVI